MKDFYTAIKERRTIYEINKDINISEQKIREIVEEVVKYTPSAFNSQTARAVILFKESHENLWDITKDVLKGVVPSDQFASTEAKIESFKNGYGTVLFFEDMSIVESLQKQFPLYKDNFPIWSQQASGMNQYVLWVALELEGLGVSLQHYNPLIDDKVKEKWKIPGSWKLIAQMPFGNPVTKAGEKSFMPIEDRVKVL